MEDTFDNLLRVAREAASEAERIHKQYSDIGFSSSSKEEHHNMVTSADIDSEKAVIDTIQRVFPDHNFIGEEKKYKKTPSPYTWIIDPLDGTNNFFKGLPHYAVSIACIKNDETVVGLVRNTAKPEEFSAVKGKGAYLDGKKIDVSTQDVLKNAMMFTGFHYDRGENMKMTLKAIEHLFSLGIIGIRRSGSAALDLCYIAAGRGDGYWEHILSAWDYAAAELIITEAGGKVSTFSGTPMQLQNSEIIASNGVLHDQLQRVVLSVFRGNG